MCQYNLKAEAAEFGINPIILFILDIASKICVV